MQLNLITAPTIEPLVSGARSQPRKRASGIYQILCKPTGKVYIGSAVWIARRKREHRNALLSGGHHSKHLQKAWNKYGANAFEFLILEYCDNEKLIQLEQVYIDLFESHDPKKGFNMVPIAGSNLGMVTSDDTKKKLSEYRKNHPSKLSEKELKILKDRMKGNSLRLGIKHTDETMERMKISRVGRKPSLGMHHSDESKAKISKFHKGIKLSEEHCKKISNALSGKTKTEVHKQQISIANSKIKPDQIQAIKIEYVPGVIKMWELARKYNCCTQTISNIINNKRMVF